MTINALPGLPEFEYIHPSSISEAVDFLAAHSGEARPLMGGTDIFVRMRDGIWKDKYLVDVKHLDGMNRIAFSPSKGLTIGSGVNMNQVISSEEVQEFYGILADACRSVASYQLRNRATIVGNICNASPAGDTIGACLLLDGILNVYGVNGSRQEPLRTFFKGPGMSVLKPGDVVTSIQFPPPLNKLRGTYLKLGRNKLSDLAIVGVTALAFSTPEHSSRYKFRLALASVAPTPLIITEVESILAESPISEIKISGAAESAMNACSPIDDVRASARYRKQMVKNLSYRALNQVWGMLN